ncbi:hypothetical protein F7Q99_03395 [Streptomyces kaniharaensis]|uniref:Uncharacterized protein n=1 Tax=Streptomyces kaniharaensis TaxID=212423 RepID=A0A6N7KLD0_9ACTN|nr:hypothetical protein [Streptomyces kaniharaensis]MQS11359.1 hypothetical protein [Streptomyces kaniharaensis]
MTGTGPGGLAELAGFLRGLADFFTSADEHVDQALNDRYGFDTAIDWVITALELHADQLA